MLIRGNTVIACNKIEKNKVEKTKTNTETKTRKMLSMSDKFVYNYVARNQLCKTKENNLSTCHTWDSTWAKVS